MDYRKTVNLPRTDFPMRANLVGREPEILRFWSERRTFELMAERRSRRRFVLHDGPPYANGHIHLGTAFNKILKDMVVRSQHKSGAEVPFRPGWDCHGMPIEHQILGRSGRRKGEVDQKVFRREAADYARRFLDIQRKEFQRLGVYGDWSHPYLTLAPEYEAREVRIFARLALDGYIYRGKRPIYWCCNCETALAEAEIEYQDLPSDSIYLLFPVASDPDRVFKNPANVYFLVWTTTPWTLPANVALIVHPGLDYRLVEFEGKELLLAENLVETVFGRLGKKAVRLETRLKGDRLTRLTARHPFLDRPSVVVSADFVSAEDGSGVVHSAPGHGEEDFLVGREHNLPILSPVDETGRFTAEVADWAGQSVWEANPKIIECLRDRGRLLLAETVTHSYPTCWRCKKPVIFRATEQWFLNIDHQDLRRRLKTAAADIAFLPSESRNRLEGMLETRPDWCLSRQRHWGVPVPILFCRACRKPLVDRAVFDRIASVFEAEGSDAWFEKGPDYFVPEGVACGCGGRDFVQEKDILDVWFDSGTSWAGVLEPDGLHPADLYLEGSDQHRGWFQTSLITSVATRGVPPFRAVLTHGFLVDEAGRKMSKSLGNVITPADVLKEFGADILRLWAAGQDYRNDAKASLSLLTQVSGQYRTLRNTVRFILGNLADFDPAADALERDKLRPVDRWILAELAELSAGVVDQYRQFSLHRASAQLYDFCNLTLSAFYLDILKDRLYTCAPDSDARRSAQTALYLVVRQLINLLAPVLVFTCEEAWRYLPHRPGDPESVHLLDFEDLDGYRDQPLRDDFGILLEARRQVLREVEPVRAQGLIGSSLQARVEIAAAADILPVLRRFEAALPELLIVSEVILVESPDPALTRISVRPTAWSKCPRCWVYSPDLGAAAAESEVCPKCAQALARLGRDGQASPAA